jgi:carboxypeptidase Taq
MELSSAAAYDRLLQRVRETSLINSIDALLVWDQSVNLGLSGFDYRGEQLAFLSGMSHEKTTAPVIGEWLSIIESGSFLEESGPEVRGNVREIRRHYDRTVKVPAALIMELARAKSAGERSWLEARQTANFTIFLPQLRSLLKLSKELADAVEYAEVPYDAMLEEYEPGITTAQLLKLFDSLREELVPLVEAVVGASHQPDESILSREFPVARQQELCEANRLRLVGQLIASFRQSCRYTLDQFLRPFKIVDIAMTTFERAK